MRVWDFSIEEKDIGINLEQNKKEKSSNDWPERSETEKEFLEQLAGSL